MESLSGKKEKYEPDGICSAVLKNGKRCPNPTSIKSDYWCDVHKPDCVKKRNEMKTICNNVKKCSKEDNLNSLILSKQVIEECLSKRVNLNKTCYHETVHDLRHLRFMLGLEEEIDHCNQLIKQNQKKKQTKQEKKLKSKQEKEEEKQRIIQEEQEKQSIQQKALTEKFSSLNLGSKTSTSIKKEKKKKADVTEESLLEQMQIKSKEERKLMTSERYKQILDELNDKINALTHIHGLANTKIGKTALKYYNDLIDEINLYLKDPKNETLMEQIEMKYKNLDKKDEPLIKTITESFPAFQEKTKVYRSILILLLYSLDSLNFINDSYANNEIDSETFFRLSKNFEDFFNITNSHLEKANKIGYNDLDSFKTLFNKIDLDLREIQNNIALSDDPFINKLYERVRKFVKENMLFSEAEFNNDLYQYYFEIRRYIEKMITFQKQLNEYKKVISTKNNL